MIFRFPDVSRDVSRDVSVVVLVLVLVVMMVVVMLGRKFPQFYVSQLPIDRSAAVTGNDILMYK